MLSGTSPAFYAAQRFEQEGRTSLASRAATMLVTAISKPGQQPPDDLLRVAYPLAYGDLASTAAKDEKISPLLLLALVRQESFYDADAGSSAGALGLTQVIRPARPSRTTRRGGFTATTSTAWAQLRFGASYLRPARSSTTTRTARLPRTTADRARRRTTASATTTKTFRRRPELDETRTSAA
jgi:soluble lytic murein transglycosylase-like protein